MSSDDARADVPEEHEDADAATDGDAGTDGDTATDGVTDSQAAEPMSGGSVFARQPVFVLATVLAIVSLVAATTFGILWWSASSSDAAQNAEARDKVVDATERAISAFAEVDYRNPDAYRDQQVAVSTEELSQHIKDGWKQARQVIVKAERSSEITFFDIAVEELNAYDGTATAIASSEVTLSFQDQTAKLPRRWRAQLEREGEDWKLSDIELVPIPRTQVGNQGSEPQ